MIKLLQNKNSGSQSDYLLFFTDDVLEKVNSFHKTIPGFEATPLVSLPEKAKELGIDKLWVKDESKRLGLNAFKVLGASYAITNFVYDKSGWGKTELSFTRLLKENLSGFTLTTATDGNHGRAVAWTARQLGCRSCIFMPSTSSPARIRNIDQFSTITIVIDGNYDKAVAEAKDFSAKNNAILVQDTAWEGYEQIPLYIMQGYLTLAKEIYEQLEGERFTHIFLHCGVGSMAAAIEAYLVNRFGKNKPKTIIVEPDKADCFSRSMEIGDGESHTIEGEVNSLMAGLSCGTPSTVAWDIIHKHSDYFISCDDEVTKQGMRGFAYPEANDPAITSGESGAVSLGILGQLKKHNSGLLEELCIDSSSKVMLISTEGDTDPVSYRGTVK